VRGKGSKLGEPCPKVRLSQDRMPIEPFPSRISMVRGNLVKGCRVGAAFHQTCIGGSQSRIHGLIPHILWEI
jgi:hypothetical protein